MTLDCRELLGAVGSLAAARVLRLDGVQMSVVSSTPAMPERHASLPRKADFAIEPGTTYLNAAYTHPIPRVSVDAAKRAAERRRAALPVPDGTPTPRQLFAQLINAHPSEIASVSSTSAGENLVVRALGLDHRRDGNVGTDGLHFEGALMHLDVLRRSGLDVRVVKPTPDARIDMRDLERLVDRKTRLIELSATAMYNGFQHDLKAVADLAHAHGALVYADIVHAAGAEPLDIHATGIDFAACSSFKWLMGDFGLGFLYARESAWDHITRPVVGYYQAKDIEPDYPPHFSAGPYTPVSYDFNRSAARFFEMGALTGSVETGVALLASSLAYVQELGVANIQAHRLPLIRELQEEVPRLGFTAVTPAASTAGHVTFARAGLAARDIPRRLAAAKINVRIASSWLRVSPSVYNEMADVERLPEALS